MDGVTGRQLAAIDTMLEVTRLYAGVLAALRATIAEPDADAEACWRESLAGLRREIYLIEEGGRDAR